MEGKILNLKPIFLNLFALAGMSFVFFILSHPAHAATEFVSVVDPGNGSGTDYTSLSAWVTGAATDLTAATTQVFAGTRNNSVSDNATAYLCRGGVYQTHSGTVVHSTSTQVLIENISGSATETSGDVWYSNNTCVGGTTYFTISDGGDSAIAIVKCRTTSGAADTTVVAINGFTTSATNYVKIWTDPTENYRHEGKWDEGKYRLEVSYGHIMYVSDNHVTIDGLQFKLTTDASTRNALNAYNLDVGSQIYVTNNIFQGNVDGASAHRAIYLNDADPDYYVYNNIVYGFDTAGSCGICCDDNGTDFYVYNNTVLDNAVGIYGVASAVVKNNISYNNTDNYYGSFSATSTNNLSGPSSDADIPATNARNGYTVSFRDEVNDDFHLSNSDTSARSAGINLAADSNLAFHDDVDGDLRPGASLSGWDIGADEAGFVKYQSSMEDQEKEGLVMYQSFDGKDFDGSRGYDRSGSVNDGTILTGVSNINFTTEANYIQESSTVGTKFSDGEVALGQDFRYIRVLIDDGWNDYGNNGILTILELKALTSGAVNRALNKTATAASNYSGRLPSEAVDGAAGGYSDSYATGSGTGYQNLNGSQWLKIDLGATYGDITSFELQTYNGSGYSPLQGYRLQISPDDVTYTTISTKTGMEKPGSIRTDTIALTGNYPTSQAYYVTTSDSSQIDVSNFSNISSVSLTQTTPTNTSIKYLVSFDDRSTWKYWDGDSWETSSLDNLQTNGMEKTTLEGITKSQWESLGGFSSGSTATLDFAVDLSTSDSSVTPELDNISIGCLYYSPVEESQDIDYSTEGNYNQEDSSNGTSFSSDKVTLKSQQVRYVKVLIDDGWNDSSNNGILSILELKALTSGAVNRALNKTATAASYYSARLASEAVDGATGDWRDAYATNSGTGYQNLNGAQWLKIDLGATYDDITSFELQTYHDVGYSGLQGYRLQVSADDVTYTTISTKTGMTKPSPIRTDTISNSSLYPTSQAYYVTTSDSSQLNISKYSNIKDVTLTETTLANTSIKYLVSFDDRSTWKYWDGDSWETSSLDNLQTNGMEKTTLEGITEAQWGSTGGFILGSSYTFDIAADLNTSDSSATPELDNVKVDYSITEETYALGKKGQAANFNGFNNFFQINETSNLPIYNEDTYSVSMWVKGEANQTNKRIFAEGGDSNSNSIFSLGTALLGDSGKLDVYIRNDSGTVLLNHVQSTGTVFDETWHHINWVDNNGTASLYIDGQLDSTDFSYTHSALTLNRTTLGALQSGGVSSYFFNGQIDEVRLYNQALSSGGIGSLYNLGENKANASQATKNNNGLVLSQSFDGKYMDWSQSSAEARDASGNNNHGDVSGATVAIGKRGQALSFDGATSYLNCGSSATLDDIENQGGGGMTISAWIKPRSSGGGTIGRILEKGYMTGTGGWDLHIEWSGRIKFEKDYSGNDLSVLSDDYACPMNEWCHVAVTWDGSASASNAHIYINGSETSYQTTQNGTVTKLSDADSDFSVGCTMGAYTFDGIIDETRVYNHELTVDEIGDLYRLGQVQIFK